MSVCEQCTAPSSSPDDLTAVHAGADERQGDLTEGRRRSPVFVIAAMGGAVDLALTALRSSHAGVRQIVAAQIGATVITIAFSPIGFELQGDPRALEPLGVQPSVKRNESKNGARAGSWNVSSPAPVTMFW